MANGLFAFSRRALPGECPRVGTCRHVAVMIVRADLRSGPAPGKARRLSCVTFSQVCK